MIPDLKMAQGRLIEVHGSPDTDTTRIVADYIRRMQEKYDALTCYYDIRGELSTAVQDPAFFDKVWVAPGISTEYEQERLIYAVSCADIIVIDDITYYSGDLWKFCRSLRQLARRYDAEIILVNQCRFGKDRDGTFVTRPYRCKTIQRYCSYSVDADTGITRFRDPMEEGYDDFIEYLLKAK